MHYTSENYNWKTTFLLKWLLLGEILVGRRGEYVYRYSLFHVETFSSFLLKALVPDPSHQKISCYFSYQESPKLILGRNYPVLGKFDRTESTNGWTPNNTPSLKPEIFPSQVSSIFLSFAVKVVGKNVKNI